MSEVVFTTDISEFTSDISWNTIFSVIYDLSNIPDHHKAKAVILTVKKILN